MAYVRRVGTAEWLGVAAGFVASAVIVALLTSGASPAPARSSDRLSAAASGIRIPNPVPLVNPTGVTRWAPVIRRSVARRAPRDRASVVGEVKALTPEGTT